MTGSSDELIRAYLDRYCIEWRFLESVQATTACTLFGRNLATPIMLGGFGHYDRYQAGGAPLYAQAAKTMGTAMWTGYCEDHEIEAVIETGVPTARIMKPFADKDLIFQAIEHDYKAGACALAIDIDHAYNRRGEVDVFQGKPEASYTRADLEEFAKCSELPIFCKGVLSVHDAEICAEAGIAGIVLSNHQNMFPWTVPPVYVLPEIRRAVGNKLTILADSGLVSGYDCFKALAWGADGVFTVRQMLPLFREGGPGPVAERLRTMTDELRVCLSRTGSKDIYSIDPSVIREVLSC